MDHLEASQRQQTAHLVTTREQLIKVKTLNTTDFGSCSFSLENTCHFHRIFMLKLIVLLETGGIVLCQAILIEFYLVLLYKTL
jgi:hypothetical protein